MNKLAMKRILLGLGALAVVIAIIAIIVITGNSGGEKTGKVGFIITGSIDESGWNRMHYSGLQKACEDLDIDLMLKENVKEFTGACNDAIVELAENGAEMIILSSYGYSEEAKDLVKEYPDIAFYVISSEHHSENMTSYFVRMYQARYLAGILAGMKTETNKVGYVAAMANNEVNRGINAFTLGVKRANPSAEVVVAWTGEWDSEEKETAAANALIEGEQVDVITYHQNQTYVVEAAEAAGIYSIGYHEALENCSEKYLTAVVCDWTLVYKELIRSYITGNTNVKTNYWLGLEAGVVDLTPYSAEVTGAEMEAIEIAKIALISGVDVFSGVIYDNEGNKRCGEKESIGDELLLEQFDWYVEGVRFYEE